MSKIFVHVRWVEIRSALLLSPRLSLTLSFFLSRRRHAHARTHVVAAARAACSSRHDIEEAQTGQDIHPKLRLVIDKSCVALRCSARILFDTVPSSVVVLKACIQEQMDLFAYGLLGIPIVARAATMGLRPNSACVVGCMRL